MKLLLLACLRGNPILYYGEELGLTQVDVPFEALRDPEAIANWPRTLARDGARTPMPWVAAAPALGFTTGEPWLPVGPDHADLAVDRQEADPASLLAWTRQVLAFRRAHAALRWGAVELIAAGDALLVFARAASAADGGERLLCAFNLSAEPLAWTAPPGATPLLASDAGRRTPCRPMRRACCGWRRDRAGRRHPRRRHRRLDGRLPDGPRVAGGADHADRKPGDRDDRRRRGLDAAAAQPVRATRRNRGRVDAGVRRDLQGRHRLPRLVARAGLRQLFPSLRQRHRRADPARLSRRRARAPARPRRRGPPRRLLPRQPPRRRRASAPVAAATFPFESATATISTPPSSATGCAATPSAAASCTARREVAAVTVDATGEVAG